MRENMERLANFQRWQDIDNTDVVYNMEPLDCAICFAEIEPGEGIVLKECLHKFCLYV